MVRCETIRRVEDLSPYESAWDQLAVDCSRPLSRPAWLLAWWRQRCGRAERAGRALRVVIVADGSRLLAVLPMFLVDRRALLPEMRPLGDGQFWGVGPLLSADAPSHALALAANALHASAPAPVRISFAHIPRDSSAPAALARHWPGGAELRRRERRLGEAGWQVSCTRSPEAVAGDVRALARLHNARWDGRSRVLLPRTEDAIRDAGRRLVGSDGFRLWTVRRGDKVIAATLFACAGDASQVLLTAFDPRLRKLGPGLATFVAGIRRQLDDGNRLVDLAYGDRPFKRELATDREPLARFELLPCGWRWSLARARWPSEHRCRQLYGLRATLSRAAGPATNRPTGGGPLDGNV